MRDCRLTSVWSLPDRSSRKGAGRRRELRILSGELAPPFTKLSHGLVDGEGGGFSSLYWSHSQFAITYKLTNAVYYMTWDIRKRVDPGCKDKMAVIFKNLPPPQTSQRLLWTFLSNTDVTLMVLPARPRGWRESENPFEQRFKLQSLRVWVVYISKFGR